MNFHLKLLNCWNFYTKEVSGFKLLKKKKNKEGEIIFFEFLNELNELYITTANGFLFAFWSFIIFSQACRHLFSLHFYSLTLEGASWKIRCDACFPNHRNNHFYHGFIKRIVMRSKLRYLMNTECTFRVISCE